MWASRYYSRRSKGAPVRSAGGPADALKRVHWITLPTLFRKAFAQSTSICDDALVVDLTDGRTITVPLAWFPRLAHATPDERANWRLIGAGEGIHWPSLDEDINVEGLLAGRRSGESQSSLRRWLEGRKSTG